MSIRTHLVSKIVGACVLLAAEQATALCIGVSQPQYWDTNFQPVVLKFSLHATNQLSNSTIVSADRTFIEEVRLDRAIVPAYDSCDQKTYTRGEAEAGTSELMDEIAGRFGAAISLSSATFSLERSYSYSGGPISVPQASMRFEIFRSGLESIWSDSLNQDLRFNNSKSISLSGLFGGMSSDLNVLAFLQARIGASGYFSMSGSTSTQDYVPVDAQYGYFGTATLLSVTPVPVPGAVWLFGSALLAVAGATGRKAKV